MFKYWLPAYIFFLNEQERRKITQENPGFVVWKILTYTFKYVTNEWVFEFGGDEEGKM
jgi:hypothetical protein